MNSVIIGVDEAGRGSWAGPLVSTACWFDFTKYKFLDSEIFCNASATVRPTKSGEKETLSDISLYPNGQPHDFRPCLAKDDW